MVAGIRKRMRNTGEVLSTEAQVVCRNDKFHYEFGDDPKIEHHPPPLDAERGDTVGAYAIIRLANGEVLREVMSRQQIERVRQMSRAKDGPAWTKSWDEMARKTVLKRCAKAAPTGAELERLLGRDDEIPHAHADAPLREIPPRPRREDYLQIENGDVDADDQTEQQQEPRFAITDFVGEVTEYETAGEARDALLDMIKKARSLKVLEGQWESNTSSGAIADIGDAIEDGAEPLHQAYAEAKATFDAKSGHGQAQREVGEDATAADATGQTEHPEEGQSSTQGERSRARQSVPQNTPTSEAAPRDGPHSLAVPVRKHAGKPADWPGTALDMVEVILKITDSEMLMPNGPFVQANRAALDNMRVGDKLAWSTVMFRLGDRDRALRGG